MVQLVRLRTRPSRDGKTFKYFLDYKDENGKRRQVSLKHSDRRKAQRQRDQKERELRMGIVPMQSMSLSNFLADSLERTRGQVRDSTLTQHDIAMRHFIEAIGDIDYMQVKHEHGERYIQACLDRGNSAATINKKIRSLKRLFQLAKQRGQLDENPFQYVRKPRSPQRKVHVYTDEECERLIRSARLCSSTSILHWDYLVVLALCTGMRRGELLNTTWSDLHLDSQIIDVSPKENTDKTWEWNIKDTERRTLPLTKEVALLLAQLRKEQPKSNPYVFVPVDRYYHIQRVREQGKWTVRHGICPINNFNRHFNRILSHAEIEQHEFHDLRRTCLTRWFAKGLREYDVMNLAGHAEFETTRRFYLAVREDLLQRARLASAEALGRDFVAHLLRTNPEAQNQKRQSSLSA